MVHRCSILSNEFGGKATCVADYFYTPDSLAEISADFHTLNNWYTRISTITVETNEKGTETLILK